MYKELLAFCLCFYPRSRISAHWFNFYDSESGIAYYEWRAGRIQGQADIVSPTRVNGNTERVIQWRLSQQLPLGDIIYITVRAINFAGECFNS